MTRETPEVRSDKRKPKMQKKKEKKKKKNGSRSRKAGGYMMSQAARPGNVLERVMAWVGKSDIPPEKGWKFAKQSTWSSTDSSLQCSRTPTSTCKVVTVKLTGEARDKQGEADGRYLVVEDSFIKGRRVSYISRPTQH